MAEQYDPKEAEPRIQKWWEKEGIYGFDKKKVKNAKKIYSIDNPPPTISGKMHIGHAFQYSHQDFMARYKRMNGHLIYYPFGTDDNGLPTERLVEKLKKVRSLSMSREEFIKLCLETLKEITPAFIQDWKNIGVSCDYNYYYSTIDDNSRRISQKSFIELYKKERIYKKEFPTIWCPECQTAIAQAELEDKELPSKFNTIRFETEGKEILIATTRPEMIPACVAIFVNPKDKRYKHLIGKNVKVPLFNYEVPIISDESADIEKGTGAMMVCSYGDKYDVEAIRKNKLTPRIVFNKEGRMNAEAGKYKGMKIKEAREKILEELNEKGMIKEQKPIIHTVNVHDKCGTEIEFLTTEQWFIKIMDLKKKLVELGKKVKWHPEYMRKRYENWVEGLEWDWTISRNRHFGVPIPAWNCEGCKEIILPEEKELPVDPLVTKKKCPKCGRNAVGEEMVLDTWATSSVTPQICSSLINNEIKAPYSLRTNAHDIIRTWDFYTIVKLYLHEGTIPWDNLMISGFVKLQGEKMSKSKGNVVEPQEVMSKYGADALRYWAASYKLGEDLNYNEQEVTVGKKFVTKIWNATNFVMMNLPEGYKIKKPKKLHETDRLFLEEINEIIKLSTKEFETYEYSKSKKAADDYFWKAFCDNYLEIVKGRVYNGNEEEKESAYYTLYTILLTIIKLMAPFTPYITEELYQKHFKKNEEEKSIHLSSWPEEIKIKDTTKKRVLEELLKIISLVRQEKSTAQKSMKAEIILTIEKKTQELLGEEVMNDLKGVTGAKEVKTGKFAVEFL
ncbi:valine--tRNA ligase [Candidatus Pacearchaeota archaeon CG10_big_fil_rev_8_21_14_0_10_35_13]|nr:MAG: valine--tRNA ligase [Candidatus Pacearchaeota archaeon CG10_big_fil_rev_8_21_14_0_10_35_13]